MIVTKADFGQMLFIGRVGENKARGFEFDLFPWVQLFGPGTVRILLTRPGESVPYPAVLQSDMVTAEDHHVLWVVTAGDVALKGRGRAEIQYSVGESVVKSETITTICRESLGSEITESPAVRPTWADEVLAAADRVEADFTSQILTASTNALNMAVTKAERKNRVFYGTCSTFYEWRDVYLSTDSKTRWDRLRDGDILFCRMNSSIPDGTAGIQLDIYMNSGWSGYRSAYTNWNAYTGVAAEIEPFHWRSGSIVVFVYCAECDCWLAPLLQTATTKYLGIVKLDDTVTSTSTSVAATASAVKKAYDLAKQAYDLVRTLTD